MDSMNKFGCFGVLAWLVLGLTSFAGWITHIVLCLQNHDYILLLAGAIAAPVGVVHGIGHWFGAW